MYCINCGVKLADTEKKCPLCEAEVYHPTLKQPTERPLYPVGKMPKSTSNSKVLNGAVVIMFLIPLIVSFISDLQIDEKIDWFGFVAGALFVIYVAFALPLWFKKPNPVVFVPCTFAAITLYLLYINLTTNGNWFMSFAFPTTAGLCLITSAVVTLLYYLKRGKLYIIGGAFIALGAFMLLVECLLNLTFKFEFVGWSIYPLGALAMLGGLLIYFAINSSAREMIERKLFF